MLKKVKNLAIYSGIILALLAGLVFLLLNGFAQSLDTANNSAESDKSWFLSYIEQKISAPNRQIRISNISGALSSQAEIGEITVSDKQGIWLKISDAKMDWNRLALLRGEVSINEISAKKIEAIRKPLPDTSAPDIESGGFSLPQLPVGVYVKLINAEDVVIDKALFDYAANIGLTGGIILADGDLNTSLKIARKDAAGQFDILANISNQKQTAEIAITASEPKNGILANILQIENRPAIDLSVKGKGSLDDLVVNIIMQAGQSPFLTGAVTLKGGDAGKRISANMQGPIAMLIAPEYQAFFGHDTALKMDALVKKQGGFILEDFSLNGDAMALKADAEILADGFLRRLNVNGHIANQNGRSIILPIKGATTSVGNIDLNINYGEAGQSAWTGNLQAQNFKNPQFSADRVLFTMGGANSNLDNATARQVEINIDGQISGISSNNSQMAQAIGENIHLNLTSNIAANKPYTIDNFSANANGFSMLLQGIIKNMIYQGKIELKANDLQALSIIGNTKMQGSIDVKANGSLAFIGGGFDLALDGHGKNLKFGDKRIDSLLKSDTIVSGSIARSKKGLAARDFKLGNQQFQFNANGQISKNEADMDLTVNLEDLALLDSRMKGPIKFKAAARGHNALIAITMNAHVTNGQFLDRKMQNGDVFINSFFDNTSPYQSYISAKITGNGQYDGKDLQISGNINKGDNGFSVNDLQIIQGENQISGTLSQDLEGVLNSTVHINAPDIAPLASLTLTKGRGAVQGDFHLFTDNGQQKLDIISTIKNLHYAENEIDNLDINLKVTNPFALMQPHTGFISLPKINGFAKAKNVKLPSLTITMLDAKADDQEGKTAIQFNGNLATATNNSIDAAFSGLLNDIDPKNITLALHDLTFADDKNKITLLAPTTLTLAEDALTKYFISLNNLQLKANDGILKLNGQAGEKLDLNVEIDHFPLNIANIIRPGLNASGVVTGNAKILGTFQNPNIDFNIDGEGLSIKTLEDYQIKPLTLSAKGNTNSEILNMQAQLSGSGLETNIKGTMNFAKSDMDMQVKLQNFPVNLANGFIKDQNLTGNITGEAHIFGKITSPSARFNLKGENLTAQALSNNGLSSLNFDTKGDYANANLDLTTLNITGPEQLNINILGHIPLQGTGLDVQIQGSTPMAIANTILASRGAQISGNATLNTTIKGSLKKPEFNGSFNVTNGQFLDAETNLRLKDINIGINLNGDQIIFQDVRANSNYGGSVTIGGSVSTNFANGLPIDLTITLNHARYNDGVMVAATVSGSLHINGALLQDSLITGDMTIEKADITLADSLSSGSLMAIKHKNLTPPIATTLKRAGVLTDEQEEDEANSLPFSPNVRIQIHAPNKIYVRGMGLDAELGGNLGIVGKLTDIRPIGGFRLIRGRFEILSQRLDFTEGTVTLSGNLNPDINFVAISQGSDITVTVTVKGKANAPKITFSSSPNLPQDEILARLIFKRSVGELSPLQIASLASAVAELSGITNESIFTTLRNSTGLDDLDIVTDSSGNTGLKAGRYIQDNIYLGVEAGSNGQTKGTVNLDISKNLKTKGSLDTNGDSSLGLFYEKDY